LTPFYIVVKRTTYIFESVGDTGSRAEIAGKILNAHREAIANTLHTLDLDDLEAAVKALRSARRIGFCGMGGSSIVARDAHHKLFRRGIPRVVRDDPHMQVMSAALFSAGDVVVAISRTGSTRDIIETKLLSLRHSNRGATWSRTSFQ